MQFSCKKSISTLVIGGLFLCNTGNAANAGGFGDIGGAISGGVQHAGGVISHGSQQLGGGVTGGIQHAGGVVSHGSQQAGGVLSGAPQHAGGVISRGGAQIGGSISGAAQHAGGVISGGAQPIIRDLKTTGGRAADAAKEEGGRVASGVKQAGPKISNYAEDKVGRYLPHLVHHPEIEWDHNQNRHFPNQSGSDNNGQNNGSQGGSGRSGNTPTVANPPVDVNRNNSPGSARWDSARRIRSFVWNGPVSHTGSTPDRKPLVPFKLPDHPTGCFPQPVHLPKPLPTVAEKGQGKHPFDWEKLLGNLAAKVIENRTAGQATVSQYVPVLTAPIAMPQPIYSAPVSYGATAIPYGTPDPSPAAPYYSGSVTPVGYNSVVNGMGNQPPAPLPIPMAAPQSEPVAIGNFTDRELTFEIRQPGGAIEVAKVGPQSMQAFDVADVLYIRFQSGKDMKVYTLSAGSRSAFYGQNDGTLELGAVSAE
jgi:hypothetical protein